MAAVNRAMTLDTRISIKKLELFCLVVELGSIKEAAERLYVTQPVVTAHIQSLNERLGVELLYRDGHRMRLTGSGTIVYQWANDLLVRTRDLDQQLLRFKDGLRGKCAIASSMTVGSYLLPPVVAEFKDQRPDVEISVAVSSPEGAAQEIESGQADFAVVIAEDDFELAPEIERELLGHERLVLVAAPGAPPAEDEVLVDELAEMAFVSSPHDHSRARLVGRLLRDLGIGDPDVRLEFGHAEALKAAVRGGVGVGFLFESSVREAIELGQLREITVTGHEFRAPIFLLHRPQRELSRVQMDLMAAIRRAVLGRGGSAPADEAPVAEMDAPAAGARAAAAETAVAQ